MHDRTTVVTHQAVFHRPGHADHLVDADLAVMKKRVSHKQANP
jgi:hypothetical protein